MKRGKGIGVTPILAITIISTSIVLVLDHLGVTKYIEKFLKEIARNAT